MKLKKWFLAIAAFAVMAVVCAVGAGAEWYRDYEYDELADGSVEIAYYFGNTEKNVDIPEKMDGKSVTSIGSNAFGGHTNLVNVTIPNSVKNICNDAFRDCSNLTSITIPNGLTSIGNEAFSGCASLASITIPDSVKSIGDGAFEDCASLTSVTIPDGITEIMYTTFCGCRSLTSVSIPDSVTAIFGGAFAECTSLTSIAVPNSVTVLESSAFYGCSSLTSINIPNGVTSIQESTFSGCTSLSSITLPDSVKSIGYFAFMNCTSLKSIKIPDNVTNIGWWAFSNCKSLTSVTIPERLNNIGAWAFSGCSSLTGFKVSAKNLNYVSVNGVLYNKDKTVIIQYPAGKKDKSYTIPDGVTSIYDCAFSDCTSLKRITIPDGMLTIGVHSFFGCANLTSVTIPGSVISVADYSLGYYYDDIIFKYVKYGNFKIYCYKGTAGEKYAKEQGFKYELLAKPTLTKVTGAKLAGRAADALRINWTQDTNATGYIIEMYQNGKWARVGKITGNGITTFKKSGLKASTVYKFRVKAYKMYGRDADYGGYSATVTARTNPSVVKGAKLGGRAADALRINWTKNASADGYIVEMYQGNKWVRAGKITNNSTTTFKKSGLKASTVYKFRVRAYKMSGSTALYGNYSATVTARTNPSIMKGVKIGGKAKDALRVNWTKNTSAQGYIVEMYKGGKWVRVAKITNSNTTTFRKAGLAKNTTYKFRVRAYHMSGKTALYGNYGSVSGKTAAK